MRAAGIGDFSCGAGFGTSGGIGSGAAAMAGVELGLAPRMFARNLSRSRLTEMSSKRLL